MTSTITESEAATKNMMRAASHASFGAAGSRYTGTQSSKKFM
jgi:hypothetical protein